jgi:hypothetical protein
MSLLCSTTDGLLSLTCEPSCDAAHMSLERAPLSTSEDLFPKGRGRRRVGSGLVTEELAEPRCLDERCGRTKRGKLSPSCRASANDHAKRKCAYHCRQKMVVRERK